MAPTFRMSDRRSLLTLKAAALFLDHPSSSSPWTRRHLEPQTNRFVLFFYLILHHRLTSILSSQWRFVPVQAGTNLYTIQNVLTGLYAGIDAGPAKQVRILSFDCRSVCWLSWLEHEDSQQRRLHALANQPCRWCSFSQCHACLFPTLKFSVTNWASFIGVSIGFRFHIQISSGM